VKIGLVLEGGGMKCAYGAGILDGFLEDGISFDECVAVSAGSGNMTSYLAGQSGRNLRFYTTHVEDPRYVGVKPFLKTGNFFNLHFIYGTLFNSDGPDPLDYEAMMRNPTEGWIVMTEAKTGEAAYYPKSGMRKNDYREIMASCAIPALCNPVDFDGKLFFDGGVADPIPIKKAYNDGCDRIVAILGNRRNFIRQPQKYQTLFRLKLRKYPVIAKMLEERHNTYRKAQLAVYEEEKKGRAFIFAPPNDSPVKTTTNDITLLQELYEQARKEYRKRREEFHKFLEGSD